MEDPPLASLSLTHVHYNPQDPLSYFCAWLALVPQGLCVVYITLIWATREAEIILMFIGQMGCEALNFLLKRLIKEERPKPEMYGKGYGMPSSHAQFLAFYSTSLVLFLLLRHKPQAPSTKSAAKESFPYSLYPSANVQRVLVSGIALVLAAFVALSRIYLNYHTGRQVLVGCAAGVLSAVAWFLLTSWLRHTGILHFLINLELCRWLRLRDLVVEEDLVESGWREWDNRTRRKELRKHS